VLSVNSGMCVHAFLACLLACFKGYLSRARLPAVPQRALGCPYWCSTWAQSSLQHVPRFCCCNEAMSLHATRCHRRPLPCLAHGVASVGAVGCFMCAAAPPGMRCKKTAKGLVRPCIVCTCCQPKEDAPKQAGMMPAHARAHLPYHLQLHSDFTVAGVRGAALRHINILMLYTWDLGPYTAVPC
jgi:hypothetical protein